MKHTRRKRVLALAATAAASILFGMEHMGAQDRLPAMPGADQYARMQPQINGAIVSGAAAGIQWAEDGRSVSYTATGKSWRFDFASRTAVEADVGQRLDKSRKYRR
jgi:hypothetical protein